MISSSTVCSWLLWDLLTVSEQQALQAAFRFVVPRRLDWEEFEEIDKLMRQKPRGELAALLSGAPAGKGR